MTALSVPAHPTPVIATAAVVVGVDTHSDIHVAVAIDMLGRRLGELTIPTTLAGSRQLEQWALGLAPTVSFGVEGTGSWGANLSRYLQQRGYTIVEVNRPDRSTRRRSGKTDPLDAEAAARAVLAGTATSTPKAGDGHVEMIRSLHLVRRSAQKARRQAANQLHALVVTAPDELRDHLRGMPIAKLVSLARSWRPGNDPTSLTATSKLALRSLARRYHDLSEEIQALDRHLVGLINQVAPQLLAIKGLGPHTSAALLIAAGDNPTGCAASRPSLTSAGSHQSPRAPARPSATASTAAETGRPTTPSTSSPSHAWPGTQRPGTTWPAAPPKARPRRRSSAASNGTLRGRSTRSSPCHDQHRSSPVDTYRSFGKAERFNRTLLSEFAYAQPWLSNTDRLAALDSWVQAYNTQRAHSAIGGHPPITRLAS